MQSIRAAIIGFLLMSAAGLSWATQPSLGDLMPSFEWRMHFGLTEAFFGALVGFSAALFLRGRNYV